MDRYDELLNEMRTAQGMTIEKALKIKADSTVLVQVGPHDDLYADIKTLALNEDGSERYDVAALSAEIASFWPQAIAPVSLWRQRYEAAKGAY